MENLYKVVGTSKLPTGQTKVRYANDMTRVKVLIKGGHENIDLIELPRAMTKEEAVAFLMSIDFADGDMDKATAINAEATKRRVTVEAKTSTAVETQAEPA